MGLIIKEYFDGRVITPKDTKDIGNIGEDINKQGPLMVDIEGIHDSIVTENCTLYTKNALQNSIDSWTKPYEKPLILYHKDEDGKIIGRVVGVKYTDVNTRSGTGALIFTCMVPDKDAAEKIRDGRLKTVSIGAVANDVRCSICGQPITGNPEDSCGHERGATYNGELCYWIIDDIEAKELSYVIVPSDKYAHNVKIYSNNKKNICEKENKKGVLKVMAMEEVNKAVDNVEIKESQQKPAEDNKNAEKINELDKLANSLKEAVEKLSKLTEKIVEKKVEKTEEPVKESAKNDDLISTVEDELGAVSLQLKESLSDQILLLREKLNKPVILKESLITRTQESLYDTIADLKSEIPVKESANEQEPVVEEVKEEIKEVVKESVEKEIENKDVNTITKVVKESLIDKDKENIINKEKIENEKKSSIDVKESKEHSNNDYEDALKILDYYNI